MAAAYSKGTAPRRCPLFLLLFLIFPSFSYSESITAQQEKLKSEVIDYYTEMEKETRKASEKLTGAVKDVYGAAKDYEDYLSQLTRFLEEQRFITGKEKDRATMKLEVIQFLQKLEGSNVFATQGERLSEKIKKLERWESVLTLLEETRAKAIETAKNIDAWVQKSTKDMPVIQKILDKKVVDEASKILKGVKKAEELYEKFSGIKEDKFKSLAQIEILLDEASQMLPKPLDSALGAYATAVKEITSALRGLDRRIQTMVRQGFAELTSEEAKVWYKQFKDYAGIQKIPYDGVAPEAIWQETAGDMGLYSFEDGKFHKLGYAPHVSKVHQYYVRLLEKVRDKVGPQAKIPLARFRHACQSASFENEAKVVLEHAKEALSPQTNPGSFLIFLDFLEQNFDLKTKSDFEIIVREGRKKDEETLEKDRQEDEKERVAFHTLAEFQSKANEIWQQLNSIDNDVDLGNRLPNIVEEAKRLRDSLDSSQEKLKTKESGERYDKILDSLSVLSVPTQWGFMKERAAKSLGTTNESVARMIAISDPIEKRNRFLAIEEALRGSGFHERESALHVNKPQVPVWQDYPLISQYDQLYLTLKGLSHGTYDFIYKEELFKKRIESDLAQVAEELEKLKSPENSSYYKHLSNKLLFAQKPLQNFLLWQKENRFKYVLFSAEDKLNQLNVSIEDALKLDGGYQTALNEYETALSNELTKRIELCKKERESVKKESAKICGQILSTFQTLEQSLGTFMQTYNEIAPKFKDLQRQDRKLSGREGYTMVVRAEKDSMAAMQSYDRFFKGIGSLNALVRGTLFISEACASEGKANDILAWKANFKFKGPNNSPISISEIQRYYIGDLYELAQLVKDPYYYIYKDGGDKGKKGEEKPEEKVPPISQADIQKFYDRFTKAYMSSNPSELIRMLSPNWYSRSGESVADLMNNLQRAFSIYRNLQCQISNLTLSPSKFSKEEVVVTYHIVISGELAQRPGVMHREEGDVKDTVQRKKDGFLILSTEGTWLPE